MESVPLLEQRTNLIAKMNRKVKRVKGQAQGVTPWAWAFLTSPYTWSLALGFLSACTPASEDGRSLSQAVQRENHPPVVRSVSLQPNPLVLSGPISALVQAQDDDRDIIHIRCRWFANNKLVAERSSESVEPEIFKRGDNVVVEVVPSDGKVEGAPFKSEIFVVGNTPPIVSHLTIEPDEQSFARRVVAKADVSDPDGDTVTVDYRWRKNGEVVKEGEANELDITGFSAKDSIQVDVMASDGIDAAKPVASQVFVMNNTAPRITSTPASAAQGAQYEYQVIAKDPDDDPVTYVLEVAPTGMTIDPQSGMIQWAVAPGTTGSHRVRVMAKDSKGGFATQEFDLSLSSPGQS
jgi:putative Ig domain-containing protein